MIHKATCWTFFFLSFFWGGKVLINIGLSLFPFSLFGECEALQANIQMRFSVLESHGNPRFWGEFHRLTLCLLSKLWNAEQIRSKFHPLNKRTLADVDSVCDSHAFRQSCTR